MKKQMLMNMMMAVLVVGLVTMVGCSKPKVADPGTVNQSQTETDAQRAARLEAERQARLEAERIKAQQLDDERQAQIIEAK
jgi:peptidoglycan-associated lipoprotein